jgi:hypothetical protein
MYSLTLVLHSWLRWVVLVLALVAAGRAIRGKLMARAWTNADRRANMFTTIALDIQMLLGLALYLFLSPLTGQALQDLGAAMRVPGLRYWAVEHAGVMLAAVVMAHVGNVMARKGISDGARHLRSALFFGGVVLLVLLGTPWPELPNGRPLFRVRI